MPEHVLPRSHRITRTTYLPSPCHVIGTLPIAGTPKEALVQQSRHHITDIHHGRDTRLLVIVGPCSIHDPIAALEYARWLEKQRRKHSAHLEIVMRVYFEKPRTTVGWKGLINDPHLDGSHSIEEGLFLARSILFDINRLGLPAATEFLDPITPQYIGDLVSWGAIGARTTESQIHREMASGLPSPIGFKNGTDGNIKIAIDAIHAASHPHHFLSAQHSGRTCVIGTTGNPDCHVILRGGKEPNYDAASVKSASRELTAAGLPGRVMVDCSHGNSSKQYARQMDVIKDIAGQLRQGESPIFGVMLESHILAGSQKFNPGKDDPARLIYGQSITDACLGRDETAHALDILAEAVADSSPKNVAAA